MSGPLKRWHKNLGEVSITDQTLVLQAMNGDPSSVFVEHGGEVLEVSAAMVLDACPVDKLTDDELLDELRSCVTRARNGPYDRERTVTVSAEAVRRGWGPFG
jgi:hypothetical protein